MSDPVSILSTGIDVNVVSESDTAIYLITAGQQGANASINDLGTPSNRFVIIGNGTTFDSRLLAAADLPTSIDAANLADGSVSNTEFLNLNGTTSNIQTQLDSKASITYASDASNLSSGTLSVARLPSAIPATNIANGTVDNAEFQTLNGVTSSIQAQLDDKAASTHQHSGADITSGTVATARLGSGTPALGNYLRGDGSWQNIAADELPNGIDVTKLAAGTVDNAEFQTLNGVTSSIQTQLDGKAASTHQHSGADITSGTVAPARLGSGVAGATNYLRGDGSWQNIAAAELPNGIDVTKLAAGTVDNTEFQTLNGVTSPIQTQLDGKAASVHQHSGADITSGTVVPARLGSGTPGVGNYLRGDGSWTAISTGDINGLLPESKGGNGSQGGGANMMAPSLNVFRSGSYVPFGVASIASGTLTIGQATGYPVAGGAVMSLNGSGFNQATILSEARFPVDTAKTYNLSCYAKQLTGTQTMYIGVACYNSSGTLLGGGNYKYCTLNAAAPSSSGVVYSGFIQGEGSAANQFEVGTTHVAIVVLAGYVNIASAWSQALGIPDFREVPPYAVATLSTNTSINSGVWTDINFASEAFDTSNIHDLAVNNTRLKITQGGCWRVSYSVEYLPQTSASRGAMVRINAGAGGNILQSFVATSGGVYNTMVTNTGLHRFNAGDYVELQTIQNTGSALNIGTGTRFEVQYIGP